jgi:hypothetical protein
MKKYINVIIFSIFILISLPWIANAASSSSTSSTQAFSASDFQKNASKIITSLQTSAKNYLQDREKEDLDFGLHLVHFSGSVVQDPQEQFMADFSRMSCNSQHESNLPECGNQLQELSPYAHLRATNIFDPLKYDQRQSSIAKTVTRTITDPFPDNKLNTLLSDPGQAKEADNQKTMANIIAARAGITLAQNTFNEIMSKRHPDSSGNNSIIKTIYDESHRRVIDPTWIDNTSKLSTESLLLELLQIEAFKLWMDYYKFTQNERIEALLAALVANQINSAGKINKEIDSAKSETSKNSAEIEKAKGMMP